MEARSTLVAALLLLAACSRADPPSEEVERAAEEIVAAVEGAEEPAAGPFAPRNECAELPGAEAFLAELERAISGRDAAALAGLAAEDIKLDFGGGTGIAELRRRLAADDGALWDELAELTRLGCAANSQGGLTLPWHFEQRVPVADPTGGFIVTGEDVPMRRAPDGEAPVVARLSWDAVELVPGSAEHAGFRHVRLIPAPGTPIPVDPAPQTKPPPAGYVAEDTLRSLIDLRLIAASRNGRWRIISLVAGD